MTGLLELQGILDGESKLFGEEKTKAPRFPLKGVTFSGNKDSDNRVMGMHSFNWDIVQCKISFASNLSSLNRILTHPWPGYGSTVLIIH